MLLSVIVPTHNSQHTIEKCLKSIFNSIFRDFEVIVVDDCSVDSGIDLAKKFKVKTVSRECRGGPSTARNTGAKYAQGKILVFIDSDVEIFSDTLNKIVNFLNFDQDYIAVSGYLSPQCEMLDTLSRYKNLYMHYSYRKEVKTISWAFTSIFAVYKKIFDEVGGFDTKIKVIEDTLFGVVLTKFGYKVGFDNNIQVKHLHKYNFKIFIKEEFRRSYNLIIHKLTNVFYRNMAKNKSIAVNFVVSIALLPLLLLSLLLLIISINPWIFIFLFTVFLLINFNFLLYLRSYYGTVFAFKSFFVFILDIFICGVAIMGGLLKFLTGKRI